MRRPFTYRTREFGGWERRIRKAKQLIRPRPEIELEALGRRYSLWTSDPVELDGWYDALVRYCIQTNFKHHYQMTNVLGKGSYSTVYNGFSNSKFQRVAIKCISKETLQKNAATSVSHRLTPT